MTTIKKSHKAADALDWNETMQMAEKMYKNGMYRSVLIDEKENVSYVSFLIYILLFILYNSKNIVISKKTINFVF